MFSGYLSDFISFFLKITLIDNQKFWLMESLISINCFQLFESLFYLYKPSILLQSHFPLLSSLLSFLEWLIDPLLIQISPKRFIKSKKNNSIENDPKKEEFNKFTENKGLIFISNKKKVLLNR